MFHHRSNFPADVVRELTEFYRFLHRFAKAALKLSELNSQVSTLPSKTYCMVAVVTERVPDRLERNQTFHPSELACCVIILIWEGKVVVGELIESFSEGGAFRNFYSIFRQYV